MEKKRRFKLKNEMIIEEWRRDNTNTNEDGYIDDYEVISEGTQNRWREE